MGDSFGGVGLSLMCPILKLVNVLRLAIAFDLGCDKVQDVFEIMVFLLIFRQINDAVFYVY